MIISLIAAIGKKRELGKNNKLLWHIPEDMKRFRLLTTGHVVIMGRKTFESIGKPLPNRTNIVISRNKTYQAKQCIVVSSLEEAVEKGKEIEKEEIFIIGGAQIYSQAISLASKLYLTLVDEERSDADTFFPEYTYRFTKKVFEEQHTTKKYNFTFIELIRSPKDE